MAEKNFRDLEPDDLRAMAADVCATFLMDVKGPDSDPRKWNRNVRRLIEMHMRWNDGDFNQNDVQRVVRSVFKEYGRFEPPPETTKRDMIAGLYRVSKKRVSVVYAGVRDPLRYLGEFAASWLIKLVVKEVPEDRRKPICIGFSSGRTTKNVAEALSREIRFMDRRDSRFEGLRLHSINSGFHVDDPSTAATSFIGFFTNTSVDVSAIGLFSAPLVPVSNYYEETCALPGIREAFEHRDEISAIVCSVGDAYDPENHRKRALEAWRQARPMRNENHSTTIEDVEPRGDLFYRPYSKTEPIDEHAGLRTVSVFELDTLRDEFVKTPGRVSMLVIGGQNAQGQTKWRAVKPLLVSEKLKVWTHIALDLATAEDLVTHFDDVD